MYCSRNIIQAIKSRKIRQAGYVAVTGEMGKSEGNIPPEDVAIDGRIILEWILKEIGWEGVDWSDLAQENDQ
jgi:hypothetical protein